MPVSVSIPTILRTHTGGAKTVEAIGGTLAQLIDDLDDRYGGIKARLITDGSLHRFVNVYVNDEDVRFAGGLQAAVADGDTVTILPAVAGGATRPAAGGTVRPAAAGLVNRVVLAGGALAGGALAAGVAVSPAAGG